MKEPIIQSIFPTPIYTTKINRGFTKQELQFVKEQKKHCTNNEGNINNSSDVSGVYYVFIPKNAGKLVFEYPINQYQTKKYYFNSCVGTYVLFPSTLNHYVTKNLSSEKRIAISFNFKIEK